VPFLAGISLGLAPLSHYFFFYYIPGSLIFGIISMHKDKKKLSMFLAGFFIMILVIGTANFLRFDDPTSFGAAYDLADMGIYLEYHNKFVRTLEGLHGFLFSPGLSLFIYFPIFALSPFGFYYLYKKDKLLTIFFLHIVILTYLFIGTNPGWYVRPDSGSHRYLLPILPFLVFSIGTLFSHFIDHKKFQLTVILLGITGFIVNLLGNLVWIMYSFSYGWGPEGLWKIQDKAFSFTWNPFYSPVIQNLKILSSDWTAQLEVNPEAMNYFKIGLAGCSYDLFIYCTYGYLPLILLCIAISVIGFFILKTIGITKKIKSIN
jgi:hypothetical protein